ncbi:uncharacterized protein LOC124410212 [Diprion similis]|uniref:uncharacterized protein LOC124410212 n=1 Tax=Diprion similis TaxID=362088 RepID=UPI001EF8681E|nr:uncharacterized protein LOC124410212 [Diprion similis]
MRNFVLITLLALMALEATLAAPSNRKNDDLPKSAGEIPAISQKAGVKTTRRRNVGPARSPGVQKYGLRDESVGNNGHIERVSLNRVSALDGSVDEVKVEAERPGIFAYGLPKKILENNGFIERVRDVEDVDKGGKRAARSVHQLQEQSKDLKA